MPASQLTPEERDQLNVVILPYLYQYAILVYHQPSEWCIAVFVVWAGHWLSMRDLCSLSPSKLEAYQGQLNYTDG